MSDKPLLILAYLLLGLGLAVTLIFGRQQTEANLTHRYRLFLHWAQTAISKTSIWQNGLTNILPGWLHGNITQSAWITWIIDLRTRNPTACAVIWTAPGIILGLTLLWWRPGLKPLLSWPHIACCLIFAIVLFILVRDWSRETFTHKRLTRNTSKNIAYLLAATLIAPTFAIILYAGVHQDNNVLISTLHHWMAYIGPAEVMRAGGRAFHDYAVQYGLGPTVLLAATCGNDCSLAIYWVAIAIWLIFTASLIAIVITSGIRPTQTANAVLFIAILLTTTFWVSYPPLVVTPMSYPSTGGMRFLPAVLLTIYLMTAEAQGWGRPWQLLATLPIALGALWSPESLFHTASIWGPYCCAKRLADTQKSTWITELTKGLAIATATIAAPVILAVAFYRFYFGIWPNLLLYATYAFYPPGPMPVDWRGPIWFFLATIALGYLAAAKWRALGDHRRFNQNMLALLLLFSTLSYTLGRSHSNNFLNVLPFCAVVLCFVHNAPIPAPARSLGTGMLACILAFTALFGWAAWGHPPERGPSQLLSSRFYNDDDATERLERYCSCNTADATRGLAEIKRRSTDPWTIFDPVFVTLSPQVWMALHGPANYVYTPKHVRQQLLRNASERFEATGWVLMHEKVASDWLEDILTAYSIVDTFQSGSFTAWHLKPKNRQ